VVALADGEDAVVLAQRRREERRVPAARGPGDGSASAVLRANGLSTHTGTPASMYGSARSRWTLPSLASTSTASARPTRSSGRSTIWTPYPRSCPTKRGTRSGLTSEGMGTAATTEAPSPQRSSPTSTWWRCWVKATAWEVPPSTTPGRITAGSLLATASSRGR
jgi:hypothetical protein